MSSPAEMTVEQFWQYPGCESYTREEAEDIIRQLRRFAELCYHTYRYTAAEERRLGNTDGEAGPSTAGQAAPGLGCDRLR